MDGAQDIGLEGSKAQGYFLQRQGVVAEAEAELSLLLLPPLPPLPPP